ncbi:MAG: RNA methyltransferase [Alphaproteobacteria bacterium]|nr:RNA methyltransferase [Alphaproteobacteria bacterium]
MRGYFAIGAENISKSMNLGALLRTANAFGASFTFTIGSSLDWRSIQQSDTSHAVEHCPVYKWKSIDDMDLPIGCQLVGVELVDRAINLPSFRHPQRAAYILGPEKGNLSGEILAKCHHIVRIPTDFCINLSLAGALVMYDRMISLGRFAERPVRAGGQQIRK